MTDPDVGLEVAAEVGLAVDVEQREALREDVVAGLRKRQPGPRLPLLHRAPDPKRLGLGPHEPVPDLAAFRTEEALREWTDPDLGPASSIQLLDEPGKAENGDLQR